MPAVSRQSFYGEPLREWAAAGVRLLEKSHRPGEDLPWHVHALPYVSLLSAGRYREELGSGVTDCRPATIVVHPAGELHRNVFHDRRARLFDLELEEAALAGLGDARRAFADRIVVRGAHAAGVLARLQLELRAPDELTALVVQGALFELAAAILRERRPGGPVPAWLRRAEAVLRDRYAAPPGLAELAREVGVHPGHLSRGFRRHLGRSVGETVRRRRLERSLELLRSEMPLAEVALACGFADQSHFTRCFTRRVGVSPAAWRRRGG